MEQLVKETTIFSINMSLGWSKMLKPCGWRMTQRATNLNNSSWRIQN